jgi:hypothetical protein
VDRGHSQPDPSFVWEMIDVHEDDPPLHSQ